MIPVPISGSDDELLTLNTTQQPIYENILPGVNVQPLFLDPANGVWVLRVLFAPGCILPKHYHTGDVHFFTLSGAWNYAEYPEQMQTAGSYLYEPGGSVHTFTVPADNTEPTDTLMVIRGANVNFDKDDKFVGILDATTITHMIEDYVKNNGLEPAKYITPGMNDYTVK